MPEPLIKVLMFCEWETLFESLPPGKLHREVYHQLCAKGVHFVFLTADDARSIYKWCGKQYFPEAIISPTGIMGYKGRDLNIPALNKSVEEGFVDSINRFLRLAAIDDNILIKAALLNSHIKALSPLMDIVAIDSRAALPEGLPKTTGVYRCKESGEKAFVEWSGMMITRLKVMIDKRENNVRD